MHVHLLSPIETLSLFIVVFLLDFRVKFGSKERDFAERKIDLSHVNQLQ